MNTQRIVVNAILEHGERVLIAKRSMTREVAPGKYHLPGGNVKFAETPETAIVREFSEELGITVKAGRVFQAFSYTIDDVHTVGICFLLTFKGDVAGIKPENTENDEVAWIAENELRNYFESSDHNHILLEQYFTNRT